MRTACQHAYARYVPLFGLAPSGVFPATDFRRRGALLPHHFTLTIREWRYIFCGTFRRLAPPRCCLAPCPMEPGLSSSNSINHLINLQPAITRPACRGAVCLQARVDSIPTWFEIVKIPIQLVATQSSQLSGEGHSSPRLEMRS